MRFVITPPREARAESDLFVLLHKGEIVVSATGGYLHPLSDISPLLKQSALSMLGEWQGVAVWVGIIDDLPQGVTTAGVRSLLMMASPDEFTILARAVQLTHWLEQHRFCGRCGTATMAIEGEMARGCPACGLRAYPRISPCIIVLVRRGREALLARSPQFAPGRYSTLAGFIEAGETVEDAVHREVFEEVGVRIDNLRYVSSQSWPFPHSLMLGFEADYVSGDITPQPGEIEDAQWWTPEALPDLPPSVSISRLLIDRWLAHSR